MNKNMTLTFAVVTMLLSTFNAMAQGSATQQEDNNSQVAIKKGMIKVTILYPAGEGKRFDMDYYLNKHIPMIKALLAGSLKLAAIDKGLGTSTPGAPAPYVVICYLYFDSVSAYQNAMATTNGNKIRSDVPNYTNIQPVIQISEMVQ